MRLHRTKPAEPTTYHCTSRLVAEVPFLNTDQKRVLRTRLKRLTRFCRMLLINFTIMGNHYHLLARSPKKKSLSDAQLLKSLRQFYGPRSPQVEEFLEALQSDPPLLAQLRAQYLARMGDVSVLNKELKEGFTRWYNREHEREGTLWSKRFDSVIVGPTCWDVMVVSAYIDLNALRARLVADPKDYPFCGYAEALAGDKEARAGLGTFLPPGSWKERLADYRMLLYGTGGSTRQRGKAVLKPEVIAKVMKQKGKLTLAQVLRVRVRYFTNGVVVGAEEYVEKIWRKHCRKRGSKRKTGARKMKGAEWGPMRVMRDLQKDVLG